LMIMSVEENFDFEFRNPIFEFSASYQHFGWRNQSSSVPRCSDCILAAEAWSALSAFAATVSWVYHLVNHLSQVASLCIPCNHYWSVWIAVLCCEFWTQKMPVIKYYL
jgi:hypothetical protein